MTQQVDRSKSQRERRAILYLLPMLVLISFGVLFVNKHSFDRALPVVADSVATPYIVHSAVNYDDSSERDSSIVVELFRFDPNTVTLRDLCRLGFTKKEASGILNYRSMGKIFRSAPDFAGCYQVSLDMYERLESYIVIGERFRSKQTTRDDYAERSYPVKGRRDSLFVFDPNKLALEGFCELGFTLRQSEVIVERRNTLRGYRSAEEFAECYVVSHDMFERLKPYITIELDETSESLLVDINHADSAMLCGVHYIGKVIAPRIVEYRKRLGGFASVEQLSEVKGMSEQNYEKILQQICVDISGIQKIDINFATPEQIEKHPYITALMLRKLLKQRQLKGGWSSIEDMIDDKILSTQQAEKLAPYLLFNVSVTQKQ